MKGAKFGSSGVKMEQVLARSIRVLGFGPLESVLGRATVADLVPPKRRAGVYVLGFRTGETYVGLSKDVTYRFAQHRRIHDDIEWFTFKPVPSPVRASEERRCIESIERAGRKLRNVALASFAPPSADLDLVVSKRDQQRFLRSGIVAHPEIEAIPHAFDLRRKHLKKFGFLMAHRLGLDAVFGLAAYVRVAIPCPAQAQISFWSVTAIPGGGALIRVNLHWQEVFTVMAAGNNVRCSVHLARQPWPKSTASRSQQFANAWAASK